MKLPETKRQNIIDAAIEEFSEFGFHGANTVRIAKRASVSSRTLYNHFESKEALFKAISDILVERNAEKDPVSYDPEQPINAQLLVALKRYVEVVTDPEAIRLNRLVHAELLRDLDRSRAFYAEFASYDDPIAGLIAEAMDAGVLRRADPQFATAQLLSAVKTFYFWPVYLLGEKHATEGAMEDCVAMFLAHYKVSQSADRSKFC